MNRFVHSNIRNALKSKLVHDTRKKIFMHEIINVRGNFIIKIEYKKVDDLFILHHTEVPIEHRGVDLGYFIAKDVFDYLIEHNIKTAIYCPFLLKCMKKYSNPKLKNIVEKLPTIDKSLFEHLKEPW